jgi:hypothetical protein
LIATFQHKSKKSAFMRVAGDCEGRRIYHLRKSSR